MRAAGTSSETPQRAGHHPAPVLTGIAPLVGSTVGQGSAWGAALGHPKAPSTSLQITSGSKTSERRGKNSDLMSYIC